MQAWLAAACLICLSAIITCDASRQLKQASPDAYSIAPSPAETADEILRANILPEGLVPNPAPLQDFVRSSEPPPASEYPAYIARSNSVPAPQLLEVPAPAPSRFESIDSFLAAVRYPAPFAPAPHMPPAVETTTTASGPDSDDVRAAAPTSETIRASEFLASPAPAVTRIEDISSSTQAEAPDLMVRAAAPIPAGAPVQFLESQATPPETFEAVDASVPTASTPSESYAASAPAPDADEAVELYGPAVSRAVAPLVERLAPELEPAADPVVVVRPLAPGPSAGFYAAPIVTEPPPVAVAPVAAVASPVTPVAVAPVTPVAIAPVAPVAPAYSDVPVPPVAVAPVVAIPNVPNIPPIPPVPYTPVNLVTQTLGDLAANAILGINQANPDTVPAINPALVPTLEAQANANNAAASNSNNGLANLLSSLTGQPVTTTTYRPATVGRRLLQLLGNPRGQTIPESQLTTFRGINAVANALTGLNGRNGTTIESPGRTTVIPGPSITRERDVGRRLADDGFAHEAGHAVPMHHAGRRRMPHENADKAPLISRIQAMFSKMFRARHKAHSGKSKGRSIHKSPVHHHG